MAVATPTFGPNAEDLIGYAKQTTGFVSGGSGTAATIPNSNTNWVEWLARSFKYNSGYKTVQTGSGKRATTRKIARGKANTTGGFTTNLYAAQSVNLIKFFFGSEGLTGAGPYGHAFSIGAADPQLLTMARAVRGRYQQYTDCMLHTLALTVANDDWQIAWGVMGGEMTELGTAPVPAILDDPTPLTWGHIISATLPGGASAAPVTDLRNLSLTFNNGLIENYGGGSFHRTHMTRGNWTITGSLELLFDTAGAAQAYLDSVQGTTSDLAISIGYSANAKHDILIKRGFYKDGDFTGGVNDPGVLTLPFEAHQPGTDSTWTVTNAVATTY